jgi:predicted RNA-binding Zn ribbon-like protein
MMNAIGSSPREPGHASGHDHRANLETSLELINTLGYHDGVPVERLRTADDAVVFLADHGLAHAAALERQAAATGEPWLERLHLVRGAARDLWAAQVDGTTPTSGTVERLNLVLARGPHPELIPVFGGVVVGHQHAADDPLGEALAQAIRPLIEAIAAGDRSRFRVCANDGCRWVFEDTSRGGHRRWCSMASCGNRAKVQRYRSRRRTEPRAAADSEGVTG